MSDRIDESLKEQLAGAVAAVWERRRVEVMDRVDTLVGVAASLRDAASDQAVAEVAAEAEVEAHRLAGSLGSFGFDEGSDIAAEIEGLLSHGCGGPEWITRIESRASAFREYMESR